MLFLVIILFVLKRVEWIKTQNKLIDTSRFIVFNWIKF